jgi:hypothetical protein
VGGASRSILAGTTPVYQVEGTTAGTASMLLTRNSNDTLPPRLYLGKSRSASTGGVTALQNLDIVGELSYVGADGVGLAEEVGLIRMLVDGTVSAGVVPGKLSLLLADSTGVIRERLLITSAGRAILHGDTLRISTARTPASATAAGIAGDICWDSSYIYICTATNTWKRVAIATW